MDRRTIAAPVCVPGSTSLVLFFLKEMPIKAFIHIHETIQSLAQLGHLQNLSSKGQAPM